jgi:PRTRC genetic system protein B
MNTDIKIGGNSAVELRKALMIYTGTHAYVTVHDVLRDEQGRPHYGPPEALSAEFVRNLSELLNQKAVRGIEVLPNNVLCLTDDLVAWWSPAAVRPMFFESATDQDANALSGQVFPHPPLVFVATERQLSVRALPGNERPNSDTQLLSAPYWNTYEDGSICTGSMHLPTADVSSSVTADWERGFFESAFTHPSGAVRLTSYKGGIIPMWTSVLGREAFPDRYLVAAYETLLQFIRRCQK